MYYFTLLQIVFSILIFDCLLIVYENTTEFSFLLCFYPEILLSSLVLIVCHRFRMTFCKVNKASANKDSSNSFISIQMSFISFLDNVSTTTFSKMFSKRGDLSDLKEKAVCISTINMIIAVGFSFIPFIRLEEVPFISSFYQEWILDFVRHFFCIYSDDRGLCF